MNDGRVLVAPWAEASATWGLGPTKGYAVVEGLVPPSAGWEWQVPQKSALNVGPRPDDTVSGSLNRAAPSAKNAS